MAAEADTQKTEAEIKRKERKEFFEQSKANLIKYMDAYNNRQFDVIADMYTPDCRFMPAGAPIMMDNEGIADFWAKGVELGYHKLHLETKETVGPMSNIAIDRCEYWIEDKQGKEIQRGKYIMMWRKDNGVWRYHFDINNMDHDEPIKK